MKRSLPTKESLAQVGTALRIGRQSGLIGPVRPDRLVVMGRTIAAWGPTPAAGVKISATRHPHRIAVVDDRGAIDYATLESRTNAVARGLTSLGVKSGDSVGILCRNHRGFIEATLAVSKLGADALFLNTGFAAPQLSDVVARERPRVLVHDESFTRLVAEAGLAGTLPIVLAWPETETPHAPTLDDLVATNPGDALEPPARHGAATILTSGTTGTPKGAHRDLQGEAISSGLALLGRIPMRMAETTVIAAPMFHSWGFAHFVIGLAYSSTMVVHERFDPEQTLASVARHQASALAVVPVMLQRVLDLPTAVRRRYDTSSLRIIAASGSNLPGVLATTLMDEFGEVLYNLYGSTEVAWATIADPSDLRAAPGTAGPVVPGAAVRLLDDQGNDVPEGERGRIFVRNGMLFEGYTGGGGKEIIDGFMSSGDVGHFDAAGRLFVDGRADDMIVSGGENVFPREVEDLIAQDPSVADVVVVGVPDDEFGQRLKAFVVPSDGATVDADALRQLVRTNLARYKVPRDIEVREDLPRNATGKVLRRVLQEEALASSKAAES
ncbi:MAG: AMP-binding protein [Acidimicrobiales bacterium]